MSMNVRAAILILAISATATATAQVVSQVEVTQSALHRGNIAQLEEQKKNGGLSVAFHSLYLAAIRGQSSNVLNILQQCQSFMLSKGAIEEARNCKVREAAYSAYRGDAQNWMRKLKELQRMNGGNTRMGGGLDGISFDSMTLPAAFTVRNSGKTVELSNQLIPTGEAGISRRFVNIQLNGRIIRALVDTGSYATLDVPLEDAPGYGLTELSKIAVQGKGLGSTTADRKSHYAVAGTLMLGEAEFQNILIYISPGLKYAIVGEGLLRYFDSVTFLADKIVVSSTGLESPENCVPARFGLTNIFSSGKFIFPAKLDGVNVDATFDSGGAFDLGVLGSSMNAKPITGARQTVKSSVAAGVREMEILRYRAEVTVGNSPAISSASSVAFPNEAKHPSFDVLLGSGVLNAYNVRLDYKSNLFCMMRRRNVPEGTRTRGVQITDSSMIASPS